MIQELDIVKLMRNLSTVDLDGDAISITAGSEGTVIVNSIDSLDCVVEFGDKPENTMMVTVNKQDLKLVWSHEQEARKRSAS
jgi:hypothetical protein